jgi:hypothetical protein
MHVVCEAVIPYPRPRIWAVLRDKLVELARYMPNIRKIQQKEREERAGAVRLVNVWHGGGQIPSEARAFLTESMLSWTDEAIWREQEWVCEWRTESHAFPDAIFSKGANRYYELEDGAATRLEIQGEFVIDGTKLRGVPPLLSNVVATAVEEFLVDVIGQNVQDLGRGLVRYFEAQDRRR